jgi:hypothetical protein
MKLKFALTLIALLAASDSHAALKVTIKIGSFSQELTDNGPFDINSAVGTIETGTNFTGANAIGPTGMKYSLSSIFARFDSGIGLDGDLYGITMSISSFKEVTTASTPNGTVISLFASANDIPSILGEPAAASGSITMKQNNGVNTRNVWTAEYNNTYDDTNQLTTTPYGVSVRSGSQSRSSTQTFAPPNVFPEDPIVVDPFSSSTFSMGLLLQSTVAWTAPTPGTPTTPYDYSWSGSFQLQQVPEPSHTALPVGIAAGLIALQRRRVTR